MCGSRFSPIVWDLGNEVRFFDLKANASTQSHTARPFLETRKNTQTSYLAELDTLDNSERSFKILDKNDKRKEPQWVRLQTLSQFSTAAEPTTTRPVTQQQPLPVVQFLEITSPGPGGGRITSSLQAQVCEFGPRNSWRKIQV